MDVNLESGFEEAEEKVALDEVGQHVSPQVVLDLEYMAQGVTIEGVMIEGKNENEEEEAHDYDHD